MRYKGNSSLVMASAGATGRIPFRLHFDRYEDEHPQIENQRFYGFRELTFSSNFSDDSQIREALATEIFGDQGVPAPRAAFYRVMVDVGQGFEYWGLDTMIEDPDDGAMLDAQFGGRGGNLYKPDGPGADWTSFVAEGFEKKTKVSVIRVRRATRGTAGQNKPAPAMRSSFRSSRDRRYSSARRRDGVCCSGIERTANSRAVRGSRNRCS